MWTCPKCGRTFQNQNQGHYCVKPKDIDEYIAFQDEAARPFLQAVRETIRGALPDAEERISWSMPPPSGTSACIPARRQLRGFRTS